MHIEIMEGAEPMKTKRYYDVTFGEPTQLKMGSQAACTLRLMEATCQPGDFAVADSWFGSVPAAVRVTNIKKSSKFYRLSIVAVRWR